MPNDAQQELDLDFVAELLGGDKKKKPTGGGTNTTADYIGSTNDKNLFKLSTQFPRLTTNKYIDLVDDTEQCMCHHCPLKTKVRVEGVPYCLSHCAFALLVVIARLENMINDQKEVTCHA